MQPDKLAQLQINENKRYSRKTNYEEVKKGLKSRAQASSTPASQTVQEHNGPKTREHDCKNQV